MVIIRGSISRLGAGLILTIQASCRTLPPASMASESQSQSAAAQGAQLAASETSTPPVLGIPTLGVPTPPSTPILVFLGGYGSCKDPLQGFKSIDATRAARLLNLVKMELVRKGRPEPAYLLACQFSQPQNYIYKMSTTPRVIRQTGLTELSGVLSSLIAKVQNPEVHIVGHSYGAWAAMKLALSLPAATKIGAVVSVDAISSRTCLPEQFLGSIVKEPAPGCTQAPRDITAAETSQLAQRAKNWLNLYELDSRFLHSSPMSSANNTLRRYPLRGILAHGDIFDDNWMGTTLLSLIAQ